VGHCRALPRDCLQHLSLESSACKLCGGAKCCLLSTHLETQQHCYKEQETAKVSKHMLAVHRAALGHRGGAEAGALT